MEDVGERLQEAKRRAKVLPGWTTEWPTTPGRYWFYGWLSPFARRNFPPTLYSVIVGVSSSSILYIADGAFMFKKDGAVGYWQPAIVPDLPVFPTSGKNAEEG